MYSEVIFCRFVTSVRQYNLLFVFVSICEVSIFVCQWRWAEPIGREKLGGALSFRNGAPKVAILQGKYGKVMINDWNFGTPGTPISRLVVVMNANMCCAQAEMLRKPPNTAQLQHQATRKSQDISQQLLWIDVDVAKGVFIGLVVGAQVGLFVASSIGAEFCAGLGSGATVKPDVYRNSNRPTAVTFFVMHLQNWSTLYNTLQHSTTFHQDSLNIPFYMFLRPVPLRGAKLKSWKHHASQRSSMVRPCHHGHQCPLKSSLLVPKLIPPTKRNTSTSNSFKDQKHRVYIIFYNAALILNLVMDIVLQGTTRTDGTDGQTDEWTYRKVAWTVVKRQHNCQGLYVVTCGHILQLGSKYSFSTGIIDVSWKEKVLLCFSVAYVMMLPSWRTRSSSKNLFHTFSLVILVRSWPWTIDPTLWYHLMCTQYVDWFSVSRCEATWATCKWWE